jgi:anti-sigma-K factor RskA
MTEDDDIDGLAGEYVLGSLDTATRARVNARRRVDASLADAIEAWQGRLCPLSETTPGISPPPHLYNRTLSRISGKTGRSTQLTQIVALHRIRKDMGSIALLGGALAACVALAIGWFIHSQPATSSKRVSAIDCSRLYKEFWGKLEDEKVTAISAEHLAGVSRMALRAYDACQAGDALDANALFNRLGRIQF